MAGGRSRDGAVQDQIEACVEDALKSASWSRRLSDFLVKKFTILLL